ncbi:charged multivesicular body protein 7 [Brevipalpus obovatus]|uniref:charged multivesicular body protein 7 n=1 Tax=Brevipalpus obovatus TaxID=246614 RepID=UPI003D9F05EA
MSTSKPPQSPMSPTSGGDGMDGTDNPRIRHLYGKFRERDLNPEGFDGKMNHWIVSINDWCSREHVFGITVTDIRRHFRHGTLVPDADCVRLVFSEMLRRSCLMPKVEFMSKKSHRASGGGQGWLSWGFDSLKKPLSFGFSLISGQGDGKEQCEVIDDRVGMLTEFVNLEALTSSSKDLIRVLTEHSMIGKCLVMDEFVSFVNKNWSINSKQLDILIKYMENNGQAVRRKEKEISYIKFGEAVEFTDFDLTLAKMETARTMLENDVDKTSNEMEELRNKSKEVLKSGNKLKAKNLLRQKKALESVMEKKENQLNALNALIVQLHDAKSTKIVFDACQSYAGSVKSAIKAESLDSVLADVEETMEQYNDLKFDLSRIAPSVDDNELEDELAELMDENAEGAESEESAADLSLPEVPTGTVDDLEERLNNLRSQRREQVDTAK